MDFGYFFQSKICSQFSKLEKRCPSCLHYLKMRFQAKVCTKTLRHQLTHLSNVLRAVGEQQWCVGSLGTQNTSFQSRSAKTHTAIISEVKYGSKGGRMLVPSTSGLFPNFGFPQKNEHGTKAARDHHVRLQGTDLAHAFTIFSLAERQIIF